MRQYLTPESKKNEIRMLLNHPSYKDKVFIVVEGGSDIRLFRSLLKSRKLTIESINGKSELKKVVDELNAEFNSQIVGIRDADFDRLLEKPLESECIFMTDAHDIEIMMLSSKSFENLIDEYASAESYYELKEQLKKSVFDAAYQLGIIRLLNEKYLLKLNFRSLNFSSFVNIHKCNIDIDVERLLDQLFAKSTSKSDELTKEYLVLKINEHQQNKYCKLQICCGHDVTKLIEKVFSQKWAAVDNKINQKKIESALRLGYTKEMFTSTNLCKDLTSALSHLGDIL